MFLHRERYFSDTAAFEKVAEGAVSLAGLRFATDSSVRIIEDWDGTRSMVGPDSMGQNDIEIRENRRGYDTGEEKLGLHEAGYGKSELFLRGLLRNENGYFSVHIDGKDAGPSYRRDINKIVKVSVVSSVQTINNVQRALGRNPGEDAVRLTVTEGRTRYWAGEWLESFGEGLEIGVSDLSDWDLAHHDREPEAGVQSWIAAPSQVLLSAAKLAREIKKEYGNRIHAPKEDRPHAVGEFAWGLERLADYTKEPLGMMVELGYNMEYKSSLHGVYNWVHQGAYHRIFQELGLLPKGLSGEPLQIRQRLINKVFITHIAELCLHLDNVKPREDTDRSTQVKRTKMLKRIIDEYSYISL